MRRDTNYVGDIEGATRLDRWERRNKPDHFSTDDIPGSRPMTQQRARKTTFHCNSDIPGSSSCIKSFRTDRVVNPLQPEYNLPKSVMAPIPVPKFINDNMNISDIPGASPNASRPFETRDSHNVFDVPGATQITSFLHLKKNRRSEKHVEPQVRRSTRSSNPLQPVYSIYGIDIQDHPKTRPNKLESRFVHKMAPSEIPGARSKKQWKGRPTNQVHDIEGATADTVERGIITKRIPSSPLNPRYKLLDGDFSRLDSTRGSSAPSPLPLTKEIIRSVKKQATTMEGVPVSVVAHNTLFPQSKPLAVVEGLASISSFSKLDSTPRPKAATSKYQVPVPKLQLGTIAKARARQSNVFNQAVLSQEKFAVQNLPDSFDDKSTYWNK